MAERKRKHDSEAERGDEAGDDIPIPKRKKAAKDVLVIINPSTGFCLPGALPPEEEERHGHMKVVAFDPQRDVDGEESDAEEYDETADMFLEFARRRKSTTAPLKMIDLRATRPSANLMKHVMRWEADMHSKRGLTEPCLQDVQGMQCDRLDFTAFPSVGQVVFFPDFLPFLASVGCGLATRPLV